MVDKYLKKTETYIYADDDLLVHDLEEVEGLVISVGVGDAGKIPALDLGGQLDLSLIPTTLTGKDADTLDGQHRLLTINADHSHQSIGAMGGKVDHGLALDGLMDDDHTQYLLATGTRILSGDWDIGAGRMIQGEKIQARSNLGLSLFEDSGVGIFVKDGGNVGVGTSVPYAEFETKGTSPSISLMNSDVTQNWYMGINESDGDKLYIGQGYGTKQGVGLDWLVIVPATGYVGFGKTNPLYCLDGIGDLNLDTGHVIRLATAQVVGERITDARINDDIEAAFTALYPDASGILDAIRDAMIGHGLMQA